MIHDPRHGKVKIWVWFEGLPTSCWGGSREREREWRPRKHGCCWKGAAPEFDAVDRASMPRLSFFFFLDLRRIGLIRLELGLIGHIGPYRSATVTADTAETGRKQPKHAEICCETCWSKRNSDLRCVSCLLLYLFCESSILMCFLRIF